MLILADKITWDDKDDDDEDGKRKSMTALIVNCGDKAE